MSSTIEHKQAINILRNAGGLTRLGALARRQDLAETAVLGQVLFQGDKLS